MQTVLGNPMASPATLGVSNAAVFGANLSIVAFAGGFLSTGNNLTSYTASADPFATSALAFLFAAVSVLVILALCRLRDCPPAAPSAPAAPRRRPARSRPVFSFSASRVCPCAASPEFSQSIFPHAPPRRNPTGGLQI